MSFVRVDPGEASRFADPAEDAKGPVTTDRGLGEGALYDMLYEVTF